MKTIALLPLKANSERVTGKNFRKIGGKPLFRWVLDTLISVKEIQKIVINTDARDILKKNGLIENDKIIIRDRKKEICGDLVPMNLIIEDDINFLDADAYIQTHTTNPFISADTIKNALKLFNKHTQDKTADSVFTVNKIQERFYDINANPINHDPKNLLRTQDLNPYFKENSNLYVFSKNSFKDANARIGLVPAMYEMSEIESIDIDNEDDWRLAEILMQDK